MNDRPNAQVLVVKCAKNKKMFGMRLEEVQHRQWAINWAFPLSEKRASAEKFDRTKIEGSFNFTNEYPGCPYCGNTGVISCGSCGKLSCWDGKNNTATCGNCGKTMQISGTITEIDADGDL